MKTKNGVQSNELHVVLGATGGIGSALVGELLERGHRVRAVSRSGDVTPHLGNVEAVRADVSTVEGAKAACAGAAVVYHAVQPAYTRWPQDFPPMTDAIIGGVVAAGAKLVFADNLYMYGAGPQPMTENTPQEATSRKGQTRILMAGKLLEAHHSGRVCVVLGRASDYYGPGGTFSLAGNNLFGVAIAGKMVRWPASLDVPHQFNYLPDIARALVILGEREEADGGVWHLPAAGPLTARRFTELVSAEIGVSIKTAALSKTAAHLAGAFISPLREFPEIWYQHAQPFFSDASKFQKTFGPFEPTPHEEAIAHTVTWFRGRTGRSAA